MVVIGILPYKTSQGELLIKTIVGRPLIKYITILNGSSQSE